MYAVYQNGCCITGIGETKEEAITDAEEWADTENLDPIEMPSSQVAIGDMCIAKCSKELADEVLKNGGDLKPETEFTYNWDKEILELIQN